MSLLNFQLFLGYILHTIFPLTFLYIFSVMTIFKVVFIIIFISVQIPTCDSSLSSRDLIFPTSARRSPAIVTMPTSAVPEPARTPTNPITFATVRGPDLVETVATDVSFYQQCFRTNLRHRDNTMCVIFFIYSSQTYNLFFTLILQGR